MLSVTMFWLNILEIISINYIPVIYKWYKNSATRKDCRTCLGCNVVVFALISAMLHKPYNIILTVCLILTCRRVNDALDSLFMAGRQRNIVKAAAHFFIAKMFFFYQVHFRRTENHTKFLFGFFFKGKLKQFGISGYKCWLHWIDQLQFLYSWLFDDYEHVQRADIIGANSALQFV